MTVYADTSVFVSLYLLDAHSEEAQQQMALHPRVWLTPLHRAEWTHAIAQHVFQQKITAREAQVVYRDFERVASLVYGWKQVYQSKRSRPASHLHGTA